MILQKYPMAATCGRVCVRFCEMACRRNLVDKAVGIKTLKRYVVRAAVGRSRAAVHARHDGADRSAPTCASRWSAPVPAGVACAYHLLLRGYRVDVLEALNEAGGMAAIGIPSYRLPKDVLRSESDIITTLGGRFLFNKALGRDYSHRRPVRPRLSRRCSWRSAASRGRCSASTDEDPTMPGYESGIAFLLKVHDHVAGKQEMKLSGDVVVVGGGNVAMDCARSALRMGAATVHLVYRRTPRGHAGRRRGDRGGGAGRHRVPLPRQPLAHRFRRRARVGGRTR